MPRTATRISHYALIAALVVIAAFFFAAAASAFQLVPNPTSAPQNGLGFFLLLPTVALLLYAELLAFHPSYAPREA